MSNLAELRRAVSEGLALAQAQPDVREAEVFASANTRLLTRLSYASHIPSGGVEEPKSSEACGLGIQVVLDGPEGPRVGFGSEAADLSIAGLTRALHRARQAAVRDPEFRSLPRPGTEPRRLETYHDPALLALDDAGLVATGWTVLEGAVRAFLGSSRLAGLAPSEEALRRLGLIVGGDVSILLEQMAIASTHMPEPQTDESTLLTSFVTAMVEARGAKGSGWTTGTRLGDLGDEAGVAAAERAIAAIDGVRVPAGDYTVVFGRQPVADLLGNLVLPACQASGFHAGTSPFLGRLGRPVAAPELSITDHGARPGLMGSKAITCEGLPTGPTPLIRNGELCGLLSNWYETERLRASPEARTRLGVGVDVAAAALVPRNGFRLGPGGGRAFDARPGIAATNVLVEGADPVSREELIRTVGHGLYVGRIWYTYPINGLRAGDFTCTVVGDSFEIRDGRLAAPIEANTIRINDNLLRLLASIVGIAKEVKGTVLWAADEVVHAPEIAVRGVHVDEVAAPRPGAA